MKEISKVRAVFAAALIVVIAACAGGCATPNIDWQNPLQNPFGGETVDRLTESLPIDQLAAEADKRYPGAGTIISGIFGSSKPPAADGLFDGRPYTTQMSGTMKDNATFDAEQFTRDDIASLTRIDTMTTPAPIVTQVDPSALWGGPVVGATNTIPGNGGGTNTVDDQEILDALETFNAAGRGDD